METPDIIDVICKSLVALLVLCVLLASCALSLGAVSQADIEMACADHGQVQQVVGNAWEGIEGTVTVVCKDGRVVEVD